MNKHDHLQDLHAQEGLREREEERRQTRTGQRPHRLGGLQTHHQPPLRQQGPQGG